MPLSWRYSQHSIFELFKRLSEFIKRMLACEKVIRCDATRIYVNFLNPIRLIELKSLTLPYVRLSICSGAMNRIVPIRSLCMCSTLSRLYCAENPKSTILSSSWSNETSESLHGAKRMFSGLMSRCMCSIECKGASPVRTAFKIAATSFSSKRRSAWLTRFWTRF